MSNTARKGPVSTPPVIQIGDMRIIVLDGGHLWLDGGAMFGIIPKPLWSRAVEADDRNRIPLATSCFLIEHSGQRVLIETGCGAADKYDEKERGFFRFSGHWIADSLAAAGVDRESIDIVILTHLHFDHAGGATMPDGRGGFQPTFPNAKYVVQGGEWGDAVGGHCVMSGTYRRENLEPLERAGLLSFVMGEAAITPFLTVRKMPGHTRHQQGVVVSGGSQKAVLPADMMPTSAHLGLRCNMAYDLLPYENMVNKQRLLEDVDREGWTLLIGQDPVNAAWQLRREAGDRFKLQPVAPAV